MIFCDIIYDKRVTQHILIHEASEKTGIPIIRLSQLENGKFNPTDEEIEKLVEYYNLDINEIKEGLYKNVHGKPPRGIAPKKIYDDNRFVELSAAIRRYYNTETPIPVEWVEEWNEHVKRRKNERVNKSVEETKDDLSGV